MARPKLFLSLN